jgi:hypothetical protein
MRTFRCFLCTGQPTFSVSDKTDPSKEFQVHYMTYHYKEPKDATQER